MDTKAVIQEQIRELQKQQDGIPKHMPSHVEESCEVAKTILMLCKEIAWMDRKKTDARW